MTAIKQFIRLAGLTAVEVVRQPATLLFMLSVVVGITILPAVIAFEFGEPGKLVRDSGCSLLFLGGMLLGSYAASASFASDIRSGTAATVLSKPISRAFFYLAKFTGVAWVILLFSFTVSISTMLSARAAEPSFRIDIWPFAGLLAAVITALAGGGLLNYVQRRSFPSSAFYLLVLGVPLAALLVGLAGTGGASESWSTVFDWRILKVTGLISMAVLILTTCAVALASRLDTIPTIAVCSVLFFTGLISDYAFSPAHNSWPGAAVLYALIPNWQHFWIVDALNADGDIPWTYMAQAAGYGLIYGTGILVLGIALFRHTDVKA